MKALDWEWEYDKKITIPDIIKVISSAKINLDKAIKSAIKANDGIEHYCSSGGFVAKAWINNGKINASLEFVVSNFDICDDFDIEDSDYEETIVSQSKFINS